VPALRHLPAAASVLRLGGLLVRVLAMIAGIPGMHVTGGPAAAMVPAGRCSHPN